MQIEENKVYIFRFPYESTELAIPVRAQTREEAGEKLQKILSSIQTDLAMEFPKVQAQASQASQASQAAPAEHVPSSEEMPPLVQELRIDTLLRDLGYKGVTDEEMIQIVRRWTAFEYVPKNFSAIILELERLKGGEPKTDEKKGKGKS